MMRYIWGFTPNPCQRRCLADSAREIISLDPLPNFISSLEGGYKVEHESQGNLVSLRVPRAEPLARVLDEILR